MTVPGATYENTVDNRAWQVARAAYDPIVITPGEITMKRLSVTLRTALHRVRRLGCSYMPWSDGGLDHAHRRFRRTGQLQPHRRGQLESGGRRHRADKGKGGYLVSKNSYKTFRSRRSFWADHTTNSGIFIRVSDPKKSAPTIPMR